jgi:hypothetical protein
MIEEKYGVQVVLPQMIKLYETAASTPGQII